MSDYNLHAFVCIHEYLGIDHHGLLRAALPACMMP
jgi:hypothetical protein